MKVVGWVAVLCLLSSAAFAMPDEPIEVRGTVVGHDRKPMRSAMVVFQGSGVATEKLFVDQQGHFRITPKQPGAYLLWVAGVHHKTLLIPIFIDKPRTVELDVRLAASDYRATLTDLRVVGDFNKFSTESGAIAMQQQADGTFVATVDSQGDTLSYQIEGVLNGTDTICGTQADSFVQDKRSPLIDNANNQFVSVMNTNGQPVRIVFDPRQLPRSAADLEIRFADPAIPAAGIAAIARDFTVERRRNAAAMNAYVAAGNDGATFKYDRSEQLRRVEQRIREERDPFRRPYLILRYFELPEAEANVELAKRVFVDVPPASPVWSSVWAGPENLFLRIASVAQSPAEEDRFISSAHETNPDRTVRAAFLYIALMKASGKRDANTVARHYTRLMGDFADTSYAKRAVTMAPNRNIQKGKPIPDFTFVSLDDSSTVTPKTLLGKTYLIDFWAVWCGPCVGEMKNLHQAYDRFKDKGLVIVSVSFDEQLKDVTEFRKVKWPMPWFNARLSGFDSETAKAFEIIGIPKPVLVDRDGRIIATEGELRGDALLDTLARVFSSNEKR